MASLEEEDFHTLFRQYAALSLRGFLRNLGFSDGEVEDIARSIDASPDREESDFPQSAAYLVLRSSNVFRTLYDARRREQREHLLRYLASFGAPAQRIALIDVGWKGTTQDHIARATAPGTVVDGYYLGLVKGASSTANSHKAGVLFTRTERDSRYAEVFADNLPLFEMMLGAPHGSAHSYAEKDGVVSPMLVDVAEEQRLFSEVIEPNQRAMEALFLEIAHILARSHHTIDRFDRLVAENHARFCFLPTDEEVSFFSKLYHHENFGSFGMTVFDAGASLSAREREENARRFAADPDGVLKEGWWAPHTLARLGIPHRAHGEARFRRVFGPR
jgi:hypothetical protein